MTMPARPLLFLRRCRRTASALAFAAAVAAMPATAQGPAPGTAPAIDSAVLHKAATIVYQRELARIRKERHLDTESNHAAYARRLAAPMIAQATRPPFDAYDWTWQINVEPRDDLAFWCLPGGNVIVSAAFFERGRFAATELAALLAHGFAHGIAGHDAVEAAARLAAHPDAASADPNRRLLVVADILAGIAQREPYQIGHEREADAIALDLLARSGHDPRGLAMLWRKLQVATVPPGPAGITVLHPGWAERIAEIEARMPEATALYEKTKAEQQSRPAARPRRPPRAAAP